MHQSKPSRWKCPQCGKMNDADMRRCTCGRFLEDASEKWSVNYTRSPLANHNETTEQTPKYSNRLKTVAGIICILIVMGISKTIGRGIGKFFMENSQQQKTDKVLEEALTETAIAVKKQLPMMIDSETRLDNVLSLNKKIVYKYSLVNIQENEFDKSALMTQATAFLTKNVCGNQKTVQILKMGAEYNYIYFDKYGNYIGTISIASKNCGF